MENKELRMAFPEVCKVGAVSKLSHWQKDSIITGNKIRVLALGSGQKIRGRREGADRPTLVIADDLENAQNTFSADARDKMKELFESSILMAGSENTNYIFLGNLYHPHCLLSEYISEEKKNQWIQFRYAAIEQMPLRMDLWGIWSTIYNGKENFEGISGAEGALKYYLANKLEMDKGAVLLWPERYNLYDLMVMREQNEYSFLSEMQNMPLDPTQITFNIDEFHYWDENGRSLDDLLSSLGNDVEFYGACDPSLGESPTKGDYSSIIVLAKAKSVNKTLYVIVADIKRRPVDEIVKDILSYAAKYPFVKFGIEANNFQKVIIGLVEKKAQELNVRIRLEPIDSRGDKKARIQSLKFWTKGGIIQFSKKHRQLLEECIYFPKGKSDDGLDGLDMAVSLAESSKEVDVKKVKKMIAAINGLSPSVDPNRFFIQGGKLIPNVLKLLKAK
jgi:predicted phage terminase large subunit-like protein